MKSPNVASSAYLNNLNIGNKGISDGDDGVTFSDFLKDTARDSIKTMKAGEAVSAQAITGKASIADVVEAVTDAEITLQTVVALRDRMISAYQEIMRLPI